VYVNGMTLDEVKAAVEEHLTRSMHQPEVLVDVLAYNSKVIYIVTDGGRQRRIGRAAALHRERNGPRRHVAGGRPVGGLVEEYLGGPSEPGDQPGRSDHARRLAGHYAGRRHDGRITSCCPATEFTSRPII